MKTMIRLTVIAALISIASPTLALSVGGTFPVTATVPRTCVFQTGVVGPLAFGTYDPIAGTDKTGLTTFQFRCTKLTPYTVELNDGTNSLVVGVRRMAGPSGGFLTYGLFQDSGAATTPWATGTNALDGGFFAPDALPVGATVKTHTVYGRILGGQDQPEGSYSDTVTISVIY
jgi:spore coat protein U-like protein